MNSATGSQALAPSGSKQSGSEQSGPNQSGPNQLGNQSAAPLSAAGQSIGIIAGGGQFPFLIAQGARARGLKVAICGFHGHTDPELAAEADSFTLLHLGQFGKLIKFFHKAGAKQICLAGSINKPKALSLRPDWRAARIILRMRSKGDDALLRAIAAELEGEGFAIAQPADLAPGLLSPEGVLSARQPTDREWLDIRFGWSMARTLGKLDIGQCLVVREGMVVAVECLEGTDATLTRGGQLGGAGCVAVKTAKTGQDERMDLPSIGTTTMQVLIQSGFSCLALEAGKTLFFDREEALRQADAANLCVVALPPDFMADELSGE